MAGRAGGSQATPPSPGAALARRLIAGFGGQSVRRGGIDHITCEQGEGGERLGVWGGGGV